MRLLLSWIFLFPYFFAWGQTATQDLPSSASTLQIRLDSLLEVEFAKENFNGTLLVAQQGEVLYHRSLGVAQIETQAPLQPYASFRLASVSKQFTCMAIMMLKEAGKLRFEDSLRHFFPQLPYSGITLRHLMHHTSGLPDYMTLFGLAWDKKQTAFNADVIRLLGERKPKRLFAPGTKYQYSNTGYVILASIVEKVSGQRFHDFIESRIFEPLGMEDSRVFSPDSGFQLRQRVYGFQRHSVSGKTRPNDWNYLNGMVGDGGLYAAAPDLLRWDQALYTEKLVKQTTLAEAYTPATLLDGSSTGYGFGLVIDEDEAGVGAVSHGGGWVGFRTYILRNLRTQRVFIYLTNNSASHFGDMVKQIRQIVSEA